MVFPSPVFPSPGKLLDVPTALSFRGRAALIGVVVDAYGDIGRSGAMSCYTTFTIKDSDLTNGHTWDGLKIRYFAANENQLPPVRQGDVILLRNIWVRKFLELASKIDRLMTNPTDQEYGREPPGGSSAKPGHPLGYLPPERGSSGPNPRAKPVRAVNSRDQAMSPLAEKHQGNQWLP